MGASKRQFQEKMEAEAAAEDALKTKKCARCEELFNPHDAWEPDEIFCEYCRHMADKDD